MIRLDKLLADAGKGTRSQVKQYVRNGCISINGIVVKKSDEKVDPDKDEILFNGQPLKYSEYQYYMLNKPQGVVSATKDNNDKTVVELIKEDKRRDLFPVGRLDKDTEGLLLITNDGKLANNLLAPGKHVEKTYYVEVEKNIALDKEILEKECIEDEVDENTLYIEETTSSGALNTKPHYIEESHLNEMVDDSMNNIEMSPSILIENIDEIKKRFEEGVDIGDETLTKPAKLKEEGKGYLITITEGRYHQIKRMFVAVGYRVIYLKRLSMGSLMLDDNLEPGEYRELTVNELEQLKM